jgi:predicted transcriptional regulator
MTLEAMEDVDAGRVIDHQAMQAWADSLGTDTPLPPPSA